jgi:dihydrofolate reductase
MAEIALIAAVGQRGELGKDNGLLWHLPEDMAHFRETTRGHAVIMGRKTWDSLPPRFKPLPGRRNIVITRQRDWLNEGAAGVNNAQAAIDLVATDAKAFVIGGAQVYAAMLPLAAELVLTEVHRAFPDADAFFPAWSREDFEETDRRDIVTAQGQPLSFVTYRRKAL